MFAFSQGPQSTLQAFINLCLALWLNLIDYPSESWFVSSTDSHQMRKLISLSIKCNKTEAVVFIEKIQNVVKGFFEDVQFGAHHRATYVDQTDQIHIVP
jgi:hypothetical protein